MSQHDDENRAGPAEVEGAVPATPTRASVDTDDAAREAAADPTIKPGVVHEPPTDDDSGIPRGDIVIPPTRSHESQPSMRPSQMMLDAPLTYPDDGPVARVLRKLDHLFGVVEQATMFAILIIVVLVASTHAIKEKITHIGLWWSFDVIRAGTFSIAMIGAAYATQQQRHLAMDLISKKIPPNLRLLLAAVLELFTIAVCMMLVYSGWHQVDATGTETGQHLFQAKSIVIFLPLGALLIAFHAFIHLIIHLEYFARGKTPPERMRSGH
ncbi:MAG TPA: TRAP transporter small permease [Kofleriaceae bacterium]|nr:TRAP transporter small permease [Kofleriaceae bacterium]